MAQSTPFRHVNDRKALVADLKAQLRLARTHIQDSRADIATAQANMQTTRELLARLRPVAMMGYGAQAGGTAESGRAPGSAE